MVADTSHFFEFNNKNISHIIADKGADSADFIIVNLANENDIVITQDYALASMCLAKKSNPINQNGLIYSSNNIDELMFRRHLGKKLRQAGKRDFKNKKRSSQDSTNFKGSFESLIKKNNK